jgi:GTPase
MENNKNPPITTRCGTIGIVGRPNVGKSTLLNKILGEKLSITSAKPQTTRQQILGIKTVGNTQWIYIDTPGLHQQTQQRLSRNLISEAMSAISCVDVIGFVVEAGRWLAEDDFILRHLKQQQQPIVLIVNKVDRIKDKALLLPYLQGCYEKMPFFAIIPLSAKRGDNVDALEKALALPLPVAEFIYPAGQITDLSQRFLATEFIREKLMRILYKELPYGFTVDIGEFTEQDKLIKIKAIIWIERESQKAIVIGKKGELLKKIGSEARLEMQRCFRKKVYLNLWVKVKAPR